MKRCLILGVNGQDGSYLAEHLLSQGYEVIGLGRQSYSRWIPPKPCYSYHSINLADTSAYESMLYALQPDLIFSLAALHGPSGFDYHRYWRENLALNCTLTQAGLEYLRKVRRAALYYFSSSKTFAPDHTGPISEQTPRTTNCLYSLTKNASTEMIQYYRRSLGVKASVLWTFNHESVRRGREYFIPKLVRSLAQALHGHRQTETFATLDFWCDWGCAAEYMNHASMLADQEISEDVIVATGRAVWARSLAETLFESCGLAVESLLQVASPKSAQSPKRSWADNTKLHQLLGRIPTRTIESVCHEMLNARMIDAVESNLRS